MVERMEFKGPTTPKPQKTDPLKAVQNAKESSKSSGVPKQDPLKVTFEDYYLHIPQDQYSLRKIKVDMLNVCYSICLVEDMWLDCIVEDQ